MRRVVAAVAFLGALAPAAPAGAQEGVQPFLTPAPPGPPESGVSIGVSVGYSVPMGSAVGAPTGGLAATSFTDIYSGAVPLQLDLGWRFGPSLYLGAYFEYAFAFVAAAQNCNNGTTCSGGDMHFGIDFVYTFIPRAVFAPYVGFGVGYEIATLSASNSGQSISATYDGFEFARFIVGGDFRVGSAFRVGPFLNFSLGQFTNMSTPFNSNGALAGTNQSVSIANKALHEWLQFGIKGTVDL